MILIIYDGYSRNGILKRRLMEIFSVSFRYPKFVFDNPVFANDQPQSTPADSAGISAGKWHSEMYYIEFSGLSMSFILPCEPDRSGVRNLFFIKF